MHNLINIWASPKVAEDIEYSNDTGNYLEILDRF